jgi:hypothetical protein
VGKCRKWRRENTARLENRNWTQLLNKELEDARDLDQQIEDAREAMEKAESAYKKEKAKAARKYAKEVQEPQKLNGQPKKAQPGIEEKKLEVPRAQAEFERAKAKFRKEHLTKDWFALVDREKTLHGNARTTSEQYEESKLCPE